MKKFIKWTAIIIGGLIVLTIIINVFGGSNNASSNAHDERVNEAFEPLRYVSLGKSELVKTKDAGIFFGEEEWTLNGSVHSKAFYHVLDKILIEVKLYSNNGALISNDQFLIEIGGLSHGEDRPFSVIIPNAKEAKSFEVVLKDAVLSRIE